MIWWWMGCWTSRSQCCRGTGQWLEREAGSESAGQISRLCNLRGGGVTYVEAVCGRSDLRVVGSFGGGGAAGGRSGHMVPVVQRGPAAAAAHQADRTHYGLPT